MKPTANAEINSVKWVLRELAPLLDEVQRHIVSYVETPRGGDADLREIRTVLRQVQGTLRMVELYGAAMLTEEMERMAAALADEDLANREDALEVLMRAALQLPDYLDRVQAGSPDVPMVLLPLLNGLRVARDESPLPESALFLPDLHIDPAVLAPHEIGTDLQTMVKRLRAPFMRSLLGFFKQDSQGRAHSLRGMDAIIAKFEAASHTGNARKIWQICRALLEALRHDEAEPSTANKQLLGQVERTLRVVSERGEDDIAQHMPQDMLRNLLYQVAQSASQGRKVVAVRTAFGLDKLLPREDELEHARRTHQGPSLELLHVARQGVREDIAAIKDSIEIYVHGADRDVAILEPLEDLLMRVADTLGMLGMSDARQLIEPQVPALHRIITNGPQGDASGLLDTAATLLRVEHVLDDYIAAQTSLLPRHGEHKGLRELPESEYQPLLGTVMKELHQAMTRTREAFIAYAGGGPDAGQIRQVPQVLQEVAGVLHMLPLDDLLPLVRELAGHVEHRYVKGEVAPDGYEQNLFADAVTSVDYYIEAVAEGRDDLGGVLEVGREALAQLRTLAAVDDVIDAGAFAEEEFDSTETYDAGSPTLEGGPVEAIELRDEVDGQAASRTEVEIVTGADAGESARDTRVAADAPADGTAAHKGRLSEPSTDAQSAPALPPILGADYDTEILEIFIEEAGEVLESLHETLPEWRSQPDNEAALTRVRRGFHTLKGSGRLVGAELMGEFAWSIENMLNQIIRGSVTPGQDIFALLEDATSLLPQMIGQLSGQVGELPGIGEVIARAYHLTGDAHTAPAAPREPTLADREREEREVLAAQTAAESGTESQAGTEIPDESQLLPETTPESSATAQQPHAEAEVEIDVETAPGETAEAAPPPPEQDHAGIDISATDDVETIEIELELPDGSSVIELQDDVSEEAPAAPTEATEATDDGVDPVLREIFVSEAHSHVNQLKQCLAEAEGDTLYAGSDLVRALHTLNGSAQTARVDEVAAIAGPLEHLAKQRQAGDRAFEPAERDLINAAASAIFLALAALGDGREVPNLVSELGNRVARQLERAQETEGRGSTDEQDRELREIFIEEADELLASAEQVVAQWRESPGERAPLAALQRQLHTLKGGARMARYISMADLTHAFESALQGLGDAAASVDQELLDLVQEVVDALLVNLDQARNDDALTRFDWLIAELLESTGAEAEEHSDDTAQAAGAAGADTPDDASDAPAADAAAVGVDDATAVASEDNTAAPQNIEVTRPTEETGADSQTTTADEQLSPAPRGRTPGVVVPLRARGNDSATAPPQGGGDTGAEPSAKGGASDAVSTAPPTAPERPAEKPAIQQLSPAEADAGHRAPRAERSLSEQVRVRSELLDNLVNYAGEVNIYHARLGQQLGDYRFNLTEFDQTVVRLRDQLRQMEQETEAQILYSYKNEQDDRRADFDPLEMDRYSRIQELSRRLSESLADLENIKGSLGDLTRDSETLLLQQSRVSTDLQEGLMRTRMVRFDGIEARLRRVVRQTAQSLGKKARLAITGGENEIDRSVQERIIAPLEHVLRNAVSHGLEAPQARANSDKPEMGRIDIRLAVDGGDILIRVIDDGVGIDLAAVRAKGVENGLIPADSELSDNELIQLLMLPGFSTAREVTQISGRGVGLDVVEREIKQLGGMVTVTTEAGHGSAFLIRLPQTLAINQALLVEAAGDLYAVPINAIRGISRVDAHELKRLYLQPDRHYDYAGEQYSLMHLPSLLQTGSLQGFDENHQVPLILVRSGEQQIAVHVDRLVGRREVVVKPVGRQISTLRGYSGATILADGRVVLILDLGGLLLAADMLPAPEMTFQSLVEASREKTRERTVLVVDDSITIRKVTARMLERHNIVVETAKDGVDAVALLKENAPDLMLLDVEMPRMDGFEVASFVRNDPDLQKLPIVMITSRTGEKHRQHALQIGVDRYLGKPYQEAELIDTITELLGEETVSN